MRYLTTTVLSLLVAGPLAAQDWYWVQPTPAASPSQRLTHMVWDPTRNKVLLVGGVTTPSSNGHNDTWEYDGLTWTMRSPPTLPKNAGDLGALTYDTARQRAVYVIPDFPNLALWEWDGNTWTERVTALKPPYRPGFACAYDEFRQRTVLFGGGNSSSLLSDTWEWDGSVWKQRSSGGPIPRTGHAMTYDPQRRRIVLFGGMRNTGPSYGDVWEWDGTVWYEPFGVYGPTQRANHSLVYDRARGVTVLFGGKDPMGVSPIYNDLWEWNGSAWKARPATNSPPVRFSCGFAHDPVRDRFVLFGGYNFLQSSFRDTWELFGVSSQPASWTPFGQGCTGSVGVPVLAPASSSRPVVGSQLTLQLGPLPSSALAGVYGLLGASNTAWGSISLPFDMGSLTMVGCKLYVSVELAFPLSKSGGTASWTLGIPNNPVLAGQSFYQQALVGDPGVNAFGAVMSNAGTALVGIR